MADIGSKVKDSITGFTGIVTGKVQYMNGPHQSLVKPDFLKDDCMIEGQWIDDARLDPA